MEEHYGTLSLPLPDACPPEGLWPELVINGVERIHNHAVSPDGRLVAFYRDRNAQSDLFTIALDSDGTPNWPSRLTFERTFVNW